MEILRAKKNKKEWIYKSIAIILFAVTIIGFIGVVQYSNAQESFSKAQPIVSTGTVILTITLFAGFGMYAKASYIHNYESLNVFALDDEGELYRVFFTKSDVLSEYVRGILDGTMEMSKFVRIHHIENSGIIKRGKGKTEFFYTIGKHRLIQNAEIYESHEGYAQVVQWLEAHASGADYKGKKAGECLDAD